MMSGCAPWTVPPARLGSCSCSRRPKPPVPRKSPHLGPWARGKKYDVHHVFFFRRTTAFDQQPNTFFLHARRPTGILDVVRMFIGLRHLSMLRPDAVLCLQHYGNIVGPGRSACRDARHHRQPHFHLLVPWWARGVDLLLGSLGLFKRIVVNSKAIEMNTAAIRLLIGRVSWGSITDCVQAHDLNRDDARKIVGFRRRHLLGVWRASSGKNLAAAIRLLSFDDDWHLAIAGRSAGASSC